ncbi:MAG: hypothetical protein JXB42_04435 [Deltaproteobacteria bacterium]|nr:hypothetical protein [Deltaproteobacteria bacterium]
MNRRLAKMKGEGAGCFLCLLFLILSINLFGCAGAWVSGRPIYPRSWPAIDAGRECPNLSGRYRAMSDEAAPLVYEPGDHPQEMFFFINLGKPVPVPPLGRRVLPWHLAGAFDGRDQEKWNALTMYAATLEAAVHDSDTKDEVGWVEIQEVANGAIDVRAGLHGKTFLNFVLRNVSQSLWTYKSHVYECEDGGIAIIGNFPPPSQENPTGEKDSIGAKFTFFRATDGSLVALEEAYTGVIQGNMLFNKWWRWRPIE